MEVINQIWYWERGFQSISISGCWFIKSRFSRSRLWGLSRAYLLWSNLVYCILGSSEGKGSEVGPIFPSVRSIQWWRRASGRRRERECGTRTFKPKWTGDLTYDGTHFEKSLSPLLYYKIDNVINSYLGPSFHYTLLKKIYNIYIYICLWLPLGNLHSASYLLFVRILGNPIIHAAHTYCLCTHPFKTTPLGALLTLCFGWD